MAVNVGVGDGLGVGQDEDGAEIYDDHVFSFYSINILNAIIYRWNPTHSDQLISSMSAEATSSMLINFNW